MCGARFHRVGLTAPCCWPTASSGQVGSREALVNVGSLLQMNGSCKHGWVPRSPAATPNRAAEVHCCSWTRPGDGGPLGAKVDLNADSSSAPWALTSTLTFDFRSALCCEEG
jgi:hypothetical protein